VAGVLGGGRRAISGLKSCSSRSVTRPREAIECCGDSTDTSYLAGGGGDDSGGGTGSLLLSVMADRLGSVAAHPCGGMPPYLPRLRPALSDSQSLINHAIPSLVPLQNDMTRDICRTTSRRCRKTRDYYRGFFLVVLAVKAWNKRDCASFACKE